MVPYIKKQLNARLKKIQTIAMVPKGGSTPRRNGWPTVGSKFKSNSTLFREGGGNIQEPGLIDPSFHQRGRLIIITPKLSEYSSCGAGSKIGRWSQVLGDTRTDWPATVCRKRTFPLTPFGGGLEYLYRILGSRKKWRLGTPVLGSIPASSCPSRTEDLTL
jgi:hypothetical protein